jgi:hypothetical protein
MSRVVKQDIQQIEAAARRVGMNRQQRREFGDFVEDLKRKGQHGSGKRGDFTFDELLELAIAWQREEQ